MHPGAALDIRERLKTSISNRYLVERELGRGGMATVFLANDLRHDRQVAIKVLHPELAVSIGTDRFEREIRLAAKLQHPHILGLIDSGEADGLLYYVMPFVEGESLRDRLDREGQLSIEDAVQIVLEVSDALGYAHSHGVVHRDIKPENILLSGGHALVADFGIARAASDAGSGKLTQTGMALGTPVYMAPEQAVGETVGVTADLYSLGCVLYEMLAGEPPFTAKSPQALMARHSMEAVPSVRIVRPTVPEELEDAIFAAMAKVPADRPKDAAHFAEMLGLPLGATASRRSAIRHTASRRAVTAAHRLYVEEALPWWRRKWVIAMLSLAIVGGAFAAWRVAAGTRPATRGLEDPGARRIAVLYFEADDPELVPVAEGLTDGLIQALKAAKLDVVSRNGVAPFRGTSTPIDSIARALQVGSVINGSVRSEGGSRVRITTWLTDADGNDLGRKSNFLISRDSLFAAPDSVALNASERLREQLGLEFQLAETRSGTENLAAWSLHQRGQKLAKEAEQTGAHDPAKARGLLAQADSILQLAIEADARWIAPVIARGETALMRARLEPEAAERIRRIDAGLAHADHGLRLEPTSSAALALRGTLRLAKYRVWDLSDNQTRAELLRTAEADLQNAVTADPTLASAYAALTSIQYEKKDVYSALIMARNAYTADAYLSNADNILASLSDAAYDTEQFSESARWCNEGGRRFPDDYRFTLCRLWMMITPDARPDLAEAWRLAARVDSLAPPTSRELLSRLAQMIVGGAIGKKVGDAPSPWLDSARSVLTRARADATIDPERELPGYEAIMRAQIGDLDEAIALLKQYVAVNPDHSFMVGGNIHWWWRHLRARPGFQALLAQRR